MNSERCIALHRILYHQVINNKVMAPVKGMWKLIVFVQTLHATLIVSEGSQASAAVQVLCILVVSFSRMLRKCLVRTGCYPVLVGLTCSLLAFFCADLPWALEEVPVSWNCLLSFVDAILIFSACQLLHRYFIIRSINHESQSLLSSPPKRYILHNPYTKFLTPYPIPITILISISISIPLPPQRPKTPSPDL